MYYSNNSSTNKNNLYNINSKNSLTKRHRENFDIKQYEKDILEKIKKDDMFSKVLNDNAQNQDHLGDFIDRVIERSLYIYKNK
jgi:hypothetical protein